MITTDIGAGLHKRAQSAGVEHSGGALEFLPYSTRDTGLILITGAACTEGVCFPHDHMGFLWVGQSVYSEDNATVFCKIKNK